MRRPDDATSGPYSGAKRPEKSQPVRSFTRPWPFLRPRPARRCRPAARRCLRPAATARTVQPSARDDGERAETIIPSFDASRRLFVLTCRMAEHRAQAVSRMPRSGAGASRPGRREHGSMLIGEGKAQDTSCFKKHLNRPATELTTGRNAAPAPNHAGTSTAVFMPSRIVPSSSIFIRANKRSRCPTCGPSIEMIVPVRPRHSGDRDGSR
jgi:hypothetical protein